MAIAKLTMHNREYTVFLRPFKKGLMLHTMYYEDEVRRIEEFEPPSVQLKDAEVKVAHQLIKALEAKFDAGKYRDTFEKNVKELIKAHLEGREVTAVEKPGKPAPVVDLMAALKQSLAQMEGKKKPAQRVEAALGKSEIHAVSRKKAKRIARPIHSRRALHHRVSHAVDRSVGIAVVNDVHLGSRHTIAA